MSGVETHPVQTQGHNPRLGGARCPAKATRAAYEVYCAVYGPQEAVVTGNCRGGFGVNELIAYLYARSFPRSEWKDRVKEAFNGMANL